MLALELSLADDRFANTASGIAWDIIIDIIGVVAGILGCTSSLGAMIAGLDPVTVDYRSRVRPPLPRRLALPRSTPPEAAAHVLAMAEVDRLSTAEIDIVDRARAAAAASADEHYRRHLQDLFVVQTLRGEALGEATASLRGMLRAQSDRFGRVTAEPGRPLREVLNPLTNLRAPLEAIGVGATDVNAVLLASRLPGPLLSALQSGRAALLDRHGGVVVRALHDMADVIDAQDPLSRAAFEWPDRGP
ncbi:hypothetical protein [Rhodovulum sp. 12E13]|uniref:hypothetical protein n=1 Tax=Rhodovulum sp. 12E13 TaxID=2203891 RepID=UPI0011C02BDD|nr:hypothetical protein [Rhodovulum sp. 12E13]